MYINSSTQESCRIYTSTFSQMIFGRAPILTAGTIVRLHGTQELYESLTNLTKNTNIHYYVFFVLTSLLQLLLFCYRRIKWNRMSILETLNAIRVTNFFNFYTTTMITMMIMSAFLYLLVHTVASATTLKTDDGDNAIAFFSHSIVSALLGIFFQLLPISRNPVLR